MVESCFNEFSTCELETSRFPEIDLLENLRSTFFKNTGEWLLFSKTFSEMVFLKISEYKEKEHILVARVLCCIVFSATNLGYLWWPGIAILKSSFGLVLLLLKSVFAQANVLRVLMEFNFIFCI